jgi:hypothetical protein
MLVVLLKKGALNENPYTADCVDSSSWPKPSNESIEKNTGCIVIFMLKEGPGLCGFVVFSSELAVLQRPERRVSFCLSADG